MQEYKAKDHFEGALPQEIVNPGTLIKVKIYFVLEVFIKQVCFTVIGSKAHAEK